jgi:chromosome segregation ATPase
MSESAADQALNEDQPDDLADQLLPLEDEQAVAAAIQTLAEYVDDLDADQQAARERRLSHAEDIRTLQERVAALEEQNEQLLGELATLRQRTDLMDAIQSADRLKPDERAAVCTQTLYNEAWQSRHADTPEPASAAMDYNKAEGALGGSINSRSLIYPVVLVSDGPSWG